MLPEAKSAQASRVRTIIQNSPAGAEFLRNSPDYMFRIRQYTDLSSPDFNVSSTIHVHLANHVKTKHWEKQHHAVTSLFDRSLVACWTAGNSDAVVCFCQPSSMEIALNAVKLPLVFVGASKTPHPIAHVHSDLSTTFHVTTQQRGKTAPCRYQPFLSVVGCLLNSRKFWCSGLLLSAFFSGDCIERCETSFVFFLKRAKHHTSLGTPMTHVHSDLSTTFHVTTQQRGKQHHAVTSLACRSLIACWTAGNFDAVVCCYRPFPRNLRWTPWKNPWFYVGASNTTSQTFEHHVPCHNTKPWKTAR